MSRDDQASRQTLRARLRELIASTSPGERLPSERVLSQRWGAARMTVRRATDALVAEGLVARRRGSGTYVLPRPVVRFLALTSFTQDMRERGLEPASRLLSFDRHVADADAVERLGLDPGAPVLCFTRLRLGGGEPMAIETVWIEAALVPGLQPTDLAGSLYELLADRYGLVPGSADATIEPLVPDAETRALLGTSPSQAALFVRMTDHEPDGHVLMAADCIYRGDRYQLSAHMPARSMTTSRPARPRGQAA